LRFYALSRISDYLISGISVGTVDIQVYRGFMTGVGLAEVTENKFHPFWHEIVNVEPTDNETMPITLVHTLWNPFVLGGMMFARGGAVVKGGRQIIRKDIAEQSTLYWAYMRAKRPASDLSHGWGTNSQWRTDFRRDYFCNGTYYYNVDAKVGREANRTLTESEQLELLRFRCFIVTDKPHDDLWPYDSTYQEKSA